ncbi:MAG: ATP-binding cassette domain-containing protein, partial [Pseudomonadota bacterium]
MTLAVAIRDLQFAWPAGPGLSIGDLQIAHGSRVFLQGPSGSGKSTLLSLIAGVLAPQSGQLTVLGILAQNSKLPGLRRE